jgi:uncharacterized membrane protein (UPF0127 family)
MTAKREAQSGKRKAHSAKRKAQSGKRKAESAGYRGQGARSTAYRNKQMKKIKIITIVLLLLGSLVYGASPYPGQEIKIIPLYIGSEKFTVEIADTPEKQIQGLMFREFIPDDFGMLFVHEVEDYRGFWMKNCKVHLDIIYLDRNKQIINMHINVPPCKREPCKTYPSEKPARYVLELRANRAKELNLKPGDSIFFILDH